MLQPWTLRLTRNAAALAAAIFVLGDDNGEPHGMPPHSQQPLGRRFMPIAGSPVECCPRAPIFEIHIRSSLERHESPETFRYIGYTPATHPRSETRATAEAP